MQFCTRVNWPLLCTHSIQADYITDLHTHSQNNSCGHGQWSRLEPPDICGSDGHVGSSAPGGGDGHPTAERKWSQC